MNYHAASGAAFIAKACAAIATVCCAVRAGA